ncbi:putative transcriptional regulatory protein [Pseudocercospora fuligena]|uniref:Putative transcriptional regulatory protein n=1 Tax=Pseudocercospora fuligena TaxID=685502 RepID=A0A8H6RW19_9PEZI|nr:putative transcriptional regulatory protein [Pseudocercospora fuligena]
MFHSKDAEPSSDERTRHLEHIARHFLGDISLSDERLRRIVANLQAEQTAAGSQKRAEEDSAPALDGEHFTVMSVDSNTAHYSGEFSHWNFSQRLKQQVDKRLREASLDVRMSAPVEYWRANHLKSRNSSMRNILQSLPPKDVAIFLSRMYFQYAQTNTFFVEEAWLLQRLEALYLPGIVLSADDSTWICSTLMVLAVGSQFAHMQDAQTASVDGSSFESAADAVGISFYQMAAELIPDMIAEASVNSVQAFLLLAHYTLPLDTYGLAYTYLGLALKMAIQNGMHRKYTGNDLDMGTVEFRNRLWWTTYRLEKRIGILHGRPTSISSSEVDAEYPSDHSVSLAAEASSNRILENASTKLTDWLGDIAFVIHMIRRSPSRLRRAYLERLLQVRQQYFGWWQEINRSGSVTGPTRSVAHLTLCHHLNMVFLGRPFMFNDKRSSSRSALTGKQAPEDKFTSQLEGLAKDAVGSAEQIVTVCQALETSVGLARASYIEFSSCRAAVLVLLAACLNESSKELRDTLARGMGCIKAMSTANLSTRSEASILAAIEAAISRLDNRRNSDKTSDTDETLSTFKTWAAKFQPASVENIDPNLDPSGNFLSSEADANFDTFDWNMLEGGSIDFGDLALHHFDEAFSIATGPQENSEHFLSTQSPE